MWAFEFNQDIKAAESYVLDQLSSFLIGKEELSLRIIKSSQVSWMILCPDSVQQLPASIVPFGEKTSSLPGFEPRYWIIRGLVREDKSARISGGKIESLPGLPLEELIHSHPPFTLEIKLCPSQHIPYCKEETLFSIEVCTDNDEVSQTISRWLNGRTTMDNRSTFAYGSELAFFIRPPISTYAYNPRGTLSAKDSIMQVFLNKPNLLTKHCLICGQPGSGKTNSAKMILDQLALQASPQKNLLILDNKGEYRSWGMKHNINYYEVGRNPDVLRLLGINPFIPGSEVKLINHLEVLATILAVSGFTGAGVILTEYMKLVLFAFFADLWHRDEGSFFELLNMTGNELLAAGFPFYGKKGETIPVLLLKFWRANAQKYFNLWVGNASGRNLGDIQGILSARINALVYSPMNYFSYSPSATNADALLNNSYILSLKGASDHHLVLLSSLFVFLYCQSARIADESPVLKNLLVVEEAHLIMKKNVESAEVVTAESMLGEIFDRMLAELRSQGVGLILIDQSPSQLVLNVIANTGTKIIHRLAFPGDIQVITDSLGIQEPDELRYLDVGNCFYKIEGDQPQKEHIDLWKTR
jgi:hypothetical protein